MNRRPCRRPWLRSLLLATVVLAACQAETPPPAPSSPAMVQAPQPAPASPVVAAAQPLAQGVIPVPPADALPSTDLPSTDLPSTDLPDGPIYFCDSNGVREPMALEPRVETLCRRHPEMGPCQYARNACRQGGGRVFTSKGEEVTLAVEKRYDERVARVRLQEDGTVRR